MRLYYEKKINDHQKRIIAKEIAEVIEHRNLSIHQVDEIFEYIKQSFQHKPMFKRVDDLGRETEKIVSVTNNIYGADSLSAKELQEKASENFNKILK